MNIINNINKKVNLKDRLIDKNVKIKHNNKYIKRRYRKCLFV